MRRIGLRENRVGRAQTGPEQECEEYECSHGVTPSWRTITRQRLPTIAMVGIGEFLIFHGLYTKERMPRKFNADSQIGRRLRLRDLHLFFTVVQWGSMAKAAAQLGMS